MPFGTLYVVDEYGVKLFDVTDLASPKPVSKIDVGEVHKLYLGRTYCFCACGHKGLVILDVEHAETPKMYMTYNAGGCINDLHDVKLAITYTTEFAYLADGKNGFRILQLTKPEQPDNYGFIEELHPELIATYPIPQGGHAHCISKALDRDRAVDESGNQLSVFGR